MIESFVITHMSRWSSGLRLHPLTVATGVRLPYGIPTERLLIFGSLFLSLKRNKPLRQTQGFLYTKRGTAHIIQFLSIFLFGACLVRYLNPSGCRITSYRPFRRPCWPFLQLRQQRHPACWNQQRMLLLSGALQKQMLHSAVRIL